MYGHQLKLIHTFIFQSAGVISVLITKIANIAGVNQTGGCCDATRNTLTGKMNYLGVT